MKTEIEQEAELWQLRAEQTQKQLDIARQIVIEQQVKLDAFGDRANRAEGRQVMLEARVRELELLESFVRRFARIEEHGEDDALWCVVVHDDMMPTPCVEGPDSDPVEAMIVTEAALARKEG